MSYRMVMATATDGFAKMDQAFEVDELIFVVDPCPRRLAGQRGGGIGGQMMTSCAFCGEMMASTAGPHPIDRGFMVTPVIVTGIGNGHVSWRPVRVDVEAGEIC